MKLFLLGLAICYLSLKTPRFATPDTTPLPPTTILPLNIYMAMVVPLLDISSVAAFARDGQT